MATSPSALNYHIGKGIASFHRDNARSTEAGLKYFVLGALSSGMLLYGCSLIYGFTGTVSFTGIAEAIKGGPISLGLRGGGAGAARIVGGFFVFFNWCLKTARINSVIMIDSTYM